MQGSHFLQLVCLLLLPVPDALCCAMQAAQWASWCVFVKLLRTVARPLAEMPLKARGMQEGGECEVPVQKAPLISCLDID